jgi:hypothetical protein
MARLRATMAKTAREADCVSMSDVDAVVYMLCNESRIVYKAYEMESRASLSIEVDMDF